MIYTRSSVINDITPAADGILTYDLPVQPLSHLILTIKALNVTNEATLLELLAMISNLTVNHLGRSIVNLSGLDLFALNVALLRFIPNVLNPIATDNATRAISLVVPFGRRLFNPGECYKGVNRGELQLSLTVDVANAGADGLILQCDAIALPEAAPTRHLKVVTSTFTPAATGQDKVSIPLGTTLAGILLWATTVPATTAWTATIDQLELLINDTEQYFMSSYWETLAASIGLRCGSNLNLNLSTEVGILQNHIYLDFDPVNSDDFLLDTAGKQSADLQITFGDTNPIRVLPVELRSFA